MENIQINEEKDKVGDFREIITNFCDLLTVENKALSDFDVETVTSLLEHKSRIVSAYRSHVAYFIKNQQELSAIDEKKRNEIKTIAINLDSLLKENDLLLQTRMETSKNVMDTIVNIAKISNNASSTSYGAQGRYSPLDNSKNALAINRTL